MPRQETIGHRLEDSCTMCNLTPQNAKAHNPDKLRRIFQPVHRPIVVQLTERIQEIRLGSGGLKAYYA